MDPTTVWKALSQAVDNEERREYAEALNDWLKQGGFKPKGFNEKQFKKICENMTNTYRK